MAERAVSKAVKYRFESYDGYHAVVAPYGEEAGRNPVGHHPRLVRFQDAAP